MRQMVIVLNNDSDNRNKKVRDQVVETIGNVLGRHDVVIQQQLNDSEGASEYLYTNYITGAWVDALREEVEGLPGVTAAYLKPMDELP